MPERIDGDRLWAAPDPLLMDAGMGGEMLVAQVRLALVLVVLAIPLTNILLSPRFSEDYVGLISAGVALLWGTFATLWMPWADHIKSYREVALQLKAGIPAGPGCIAQQQCGAAAGETRANDQNLHRR